MGPITRGIKNAFRNMIRTFSIIIILGLSIGLAITMLVAREAVQSKISSLNSSVGNTITVSPAGMRGFEGGGEALTDDMINKLSGITNVSLVTKTLSDRLTTANTNLVSSIDAGSLGRRFNQGSDQAQPPAPTSSSNSSNSSESTTRSFTPPVTLLGTTAPTNLSSSQGGGTFKLTSGTVFDSTSTDNVALVGSNLATKNNLAVDSTFTAYATTIKVVGIFDSGNDFSNNQVIMPLVTVQKLSGQAGNITGVVVTVNSISNVEAVTNEVKNQLGTKADVVNSTDQTSQITSSFNNIKNISTISLIGALIAGAVIILLTMTMIVRERRKEIGVLKAIGATNIRIMLQFIFEAITLTLIGTGVGIVAGYFAANPITNLLVQTTTTAGGQAATQGARGLGGGGRFMMQLAGQGGANLRNIQAVVDWHIILYGLAAALVIAVIGSAVPAFVISKVRPAEVMRSE